MPIYEYQCQHCDYSFEIITLSSNILSPICPKCNNKEVTKLISPSFLRPYGISKGSGGFEKTQSCNSAKTS